MKEKLMALIDWGVAQYDALLAQLLRIPGLRISREDFARKHRLDELTMEEKDRLYSRLRRRYGAMVFCISFLLTLTPDNVAIICLACALDLALFQCVLFVAMQHIMIIYGTDVDLKTNHEEGKKAMMNVVSSGVMVGKYPILQKLKTVAGTLSKQAVQKVGPKVVGKLSRGAGVVLRRQGIKWAGVIIGKEHVDAALAMLVPLTCAFISGLVSVCILVPMCNKLRNRLKADMAKSMA